MKNFMTVFNFEFKQFFAKKSTRVIMVIYFVLIFGATFIPTIMNSSYFKGNSNDNFSKSAYVVKDVPVEVTDLKEAKKYESKEQIEKDIKDGKLEDGIVLTKDSYEYLSKQSIMGNNDSAFRDAFEANVEKLVYKQNSLDYAKVNQVKASIPKPTPINVGGDSNVKSQIANFAMIYVLTFVIYMTVVQFGGIVATNVVKEKSNRAMELLIVTVKPKTLILGKVLALSVAVLIQMGLIVGGFLLGLKINGAKYSDSIREIVNNLNYKVLGVGLAFTLTGFVMFMFMFAAFASLVSKVEDVNGAVMLPMLVFMAAFFVNYYLMGQGANTKIAAILSYFPLTSYFVMFTRYALGNANLHSVEISYGILAITTLIVAIACVRVYRAATLRYGQKLKFFKLLFGK